VELRILELVLRLLNPNGMRRRLRILSLVFAGLALWWMRAVQNADEAADSRERHRRERAERVAARLAERQRELSSPPPRRRRTAVD
jgi:hypothetical protein